MGVVVGKKKKKSWKSEDNVLLWCVHTLEESRYESRIYSRPPSSLLESISSDLNATLFSPAAAHRAGITSMRFHNPYRAAVYSC